ncbi:MAG: hypothetical protein IPL07_09860 [Acidimicrobiaceae bacterium]|nr:hypothetical protein [Acidimicrobiaceae bacterium]
MSAAAAQVQQFADDHELDELIDTTLKAADVSLEALRLQAHEGRFTSEQQRRAWFVIEGLGRG